MNLESGLTSKICNRCKISKSVVDFHKDSSRFDGYSYVCKLCRSTHRHAYYERQKEKLRAEYDPVENRRKQLWRNYKITPESYDTMYAEQDGKCKICLKSKKVLHIDHCHFTGEIRGLLCGSCNPALGLFEDDVLVLQRAIKYLGDK